MSLDDAVALAALTEATGAVRRIVAVDDLDRPVPSCPGWTVADLLAHLATVQRWATGLLEGGPSSTFRFRDVAPAPEAGPDLLAWVADAGTTLLETFGRTNLDGAVHTWAGERDGHWWVRRATLETVLHTWDAATATGHGYVIEPVIAVDGIDETFEVFARHRFDHASFGPAAASLHVHATDVDGEWLVLVDGGAVTCTHEHAKGDVAVRGTAADLWLVLWNRLHPDAVDVFGDGAVLDRWRRAAAI